jgi:hypothetical protein
LWRAREILSGCVAGGAADPAVLEELGLVLLTMGEQVEAGRYLFASGVRSPSTDEAITLFLRRHGKDPRILFAQLPPAIRRQRFADLQPGLQEDLRALGVRGSLFGRARPARATARPQGWRDRALSVFGVLIFLLLMLALGIGLVTILSRAASWMFGR